MKVRCWSCSCRICGIFFGFGSGRRVIWNVIVCWSLWLVVWWKLGLIIFWMCLVYWISIFLKGVFFVIFLVCLMIFNLWKGSFYMNSLMLCCCFGFLLLLWKWLVSWYLKLVRMRKCSCLFVLLFGILWKIFINVWLNWVLRIRKCLLIGGSCCCVVVFGM